MLSVAFYELK